MQAYVNTIKTNFENALRGILPKVEVVLPAIMTPQFTMQLLELSRNVNVKIASCSMRGLLEAKVVPHTSNPDFIEAIQKLDYDFDQAK